MKNSNYPHGNKWQELPVKVRLATFNKFVEPYLSRVKHGPKSKISRCKIFNYILYVLHTGSQWNQLKTYRNEIHWTNVYKWHNRWSKDGSYQNLFENSVSLLNRENNLDLTIIHGDGSNTVAKKGGKG
ncbi:transposase [Candidatus Falkowbacteria bacterium]|nr:transposase [Candidatus Falkowbacteria bacterium]